MKNLLIVMALIILPNVFINDVDVGGLDADAALIRLFEACPVRNEQIIVLAGDTQYEYAFADFDAGCGFDDAIEEALKFSERTGFFAKLRMRKNPHHIVAEYSYCTLKIDGVVAEIANKLYINPKDASYLIVDGEFNITNEVDGQELDKIDLTEHIIAMLGNKKGGKIHVVLNKIVPKMRKEDFEKSTQLLGSFTTPFDATNPSRAKNIKTANGRLDNTVILPKEVMSSCAVFKPRNEANGYVSAGQIVHGLPDVGIGGGICQITSTLYMAALYAEMGIVERKNHSLMVSYMSPATDATIAEGAIDLKIKNESEYPMIIQSILTNHSHTINIFGHESRSADRHVHFEYNLIETTPPEVKIIETPELPYGITQIAHQGADGAKYELYKIITQSGHDEKRVKINTSVYRPIPRIVHTGLQIGTLKENGTTQ
ncbi:MAG: VanW family protein [Defluviitaleaceae bacterium]|nr:VanW family protein [Defluviitaleaceae bacterium]